MKNKILLNGLILVLAIMLAAMAGQAQTIDPTLETAKLLATDGAADDHFGWSVSIEGDTAIVGAWKDDDKGVYSGSAYIFVRNAGVWTEQAKLLALDGAAGDYFGKSVSIDGDTAIVGAEGDDNVNGGNGGSAYIFVRNGMIWTEQAKLTASDGALGDQFGWSVSISGDTVIIGAIQDDDNDISNSGSAYIFERNMGGTDNWGQVQKLTPSEDGQVDDQFGWSVSISGDTAIVGAVLDDDIGGLDSGDPNTDSGSAYIFVRDAGGGWTQHEQAKLTASDGEVGNHFGFSVAISGDTAIVGANLNDPIGGQSGSGSAYTFERNMDGPDNWGQVQKLTACDGALGDQFGQSVSISGDTAIVGAVLDDDTGVDSGSAYLFVRDGTIWNEHVKLIASDGSQGDSFGFSVSISGDTAIVGAYLDDDEGVDSGSAYIFSLPSPPEANAGPDQAIRNLGDTVNLDGSASFDDNTASEDLVYAWSLISKPTGSAATLANSNTSTPSFVADLAGDYEVQLIVTDEDGLSSTPDVVGISSNNLAPTANAGNDKLVVVDTTVNLDGSGSMDPEDDSLTYSWTITTKPAGSTATLTNSGTAMPSFVPDLDGIYVVTLDVSDFIGPGTPDTVQLTATTAEGVVEGNTVIVDSIVTDLDTTEVATTGNQQAVLNFMSQVNIALQADDPEEAIHKLELAIKRTDGCVLRGSPDGNGPGRDWITDCAVQAEVYGLLNDALVAITP